MSKCYRNFCSSQSSKLESKTQIDGEQVSEIEESTATRPQTATQLTAQHLQRAFRRWGRWFTIRFMMFVALIVGGFVYCWDHPNEMYNLKNRISKIFSEVGSSTLNQKELQQQATEYSKQMIKDVFRDESMQNETKKFLIQILSQPDFLNTVSVLLRDLFATDVMIESVQELVINVFNDPSVIDQCKKLIGHAISAEENKLLLLNVLNEILDDKELNDHARKVANDTIKHVLNDDDIKLLSAAFLQHVLNDDSVQQSSSDSIYKIFVGAFTPNMFKRKKKNKNNEEGDNQESEQIKHVPHQHFEVDEVNTNVLEIETDQVNQPSESSVIEEAAITEIEEAQQVIDDIQDQVNHIDSVVGHN